MSDWTEASFVKRDLPTRSQPVERCLCTAHSKKVAGLNPLSAGSFCVESALCPHACVAYVRLPGDSKMVRSQCE